LLIEIPVPFSVCTNDVQEGDGLRSLAIPILDKSTKVAIATLIINLTCRDFSAYLFILLDPGRMLRVESRPWAYIVRAMKPPYFEVVAHEPTDLGLLCLRRRELLAEPGTIVTEVTLNHEFLMSSYLTASEEALSQTALKIHSGPHLRVLVGGLGLGYTAQAALNSARVTSCEVIEYLPEVIRWLEQGLIPLSDKLNREKRLQVIPGDIYQRLADLPTDRFDVILIDVDHSPDDNLAGANGRFYTVEGLQDAKRHLATDGVLGIWSYAENGPFVDALHEVFHEVHIEPITVFNRLINEQQTDWLFYARD
jgi:spermidine synthase